jgi:hypothetical protein
MNEYDDRAERAFRDALDAQVTSFAPTDLDVPEPPHRPRWHATAAVAAAVVLVAGTAIGVALARNNAATPAAGPTPTPATSPTAANDMLPPPQAGWHYESYRDLVVQAPDSWRYGDQPGSDWCASQGPDWTGFPTSPYVALDSGDTPTLAIGCPGPDPVQLALGLPSPERLWATHLALGTPSPDDPAVKDGAREAGGWTLIVRTVGHGRFSVLADADHLADARKVAASARVVTVDQVGCDTTSPIQEGLFPRPEHPFDLGTIGSLDAIAVCQYSPRVPAGEPGLVASRLLTGTDANAELGALHVAKIGGGPDTPDTCLHSEPPDTAIILRLNPGPDSRDAYVYYDSCVHNGIDDGTNVRELTEDDCARLWGDRVVQWSGSSAPFTRCHPAMS